MRRSCDAVERQRGRVHRLIHGPDDDVNIRGCDDGADGARIGNQRVPQDCAVRSQPPCDQMIRRNQQDEIIESIADEGLADNGAVAFENRTDAFPDASTAAQWQRELRVPLLSFQMARKPEPFDAI